MPRVTAAEWNECHNAIYVRQPKEWTPIDIALPEIFRQTTSFQHSFIRSEQAITGGIRFILGLLKFCTKILGFLILKSH